MARGRPPRLSAPSAGALLLLLLYPPPSDALRLPAPPTAAPRPSPSSAAALPIASLALRAAPFPSVPRPSPRRRHPAALALQPPPADSAPLPPLPAFSWRRIAYFCLNPAVLGVLPLAAAVCARLGARLTVLGAAYQPSAAALRLAAGFAAPLLTLSLLPLERLPPLRALAEVSDASKCICLYAFGTSLTPLRALCGAALISASAAVFEELAFRGVLQSALAAGFALVLPAPAAAALALVLQAAAFGVVHSYTPSPAYLLTALLAGLAFGGAFACTQNLFVPIAMHFMMDLISFMACHVQVARGGEVMQRRLVNGDSPIAIALARVLAAAKPSVFDRKERVLGMLQLRTAELKREVRALLGLAEAGDAPPPAPDARPAAAGRASLADALSERAAAAMAGALERQVDGWSAAAMAGIGEAYHELAEKEEALNALLIAAQPHGDAALWQRRFRAAVGKYETQVSLLRSQLLARTHSLATLRNAYFAECIVIKRSLIELGLLDDNGRVLHPVSRAPVGLLPRMMVRDADDLTTDALRMEALAKLEAEHALLLRGLGHHSSSCGADEPPPPPLSRASCVGRSSLAYVPPSAAEARRGAADEAEAAPAAARLGLPSNAFSSDVLGSLAAIGVVRAGGRCAEALEALQLPWLEREYDLYHLYMVQTANTRLYDQRMLRQMGEALAASQAEVGALKAAARAEEGKVAVLSIKLGVLAAQCKRLKEEAARRRADDAAAAKGALLETGAEEQGAPWPLPLPMLPMSVRVDCATQTGREDGGGEGEGRGETGGGALAAASFKAAKEEAKEEARKEAREEVAGEERVKAREEAREAMDDAVEEAKEEARQQARAEAELSARAEAAAIAQALEEVRLEAKEQARAELREEVRRAEGEAMRGELRAEAEAAVRAELEAELEAELQGRPAVAPPHRVLTAALREKWAHVVAEGQPAHRRVVRRQSSTLDGGAAVGGSADDLDRSGRSSPLLVALDDLDLRKSSTSHLADPDLATWQRRVLGGLGRTCTAKEMKKTLHKSTSIDAPHLKPALDDFEKASLTCLFAEQFHPLVAVFKHYCLFGATAPEFSLGEAHFAAFCADLRLDAPAPAALPPLFHASLPAKRAATHKKLPHAGAAGAALVARGGRKHSLNLHDFLGALVRLAAARAPAAPRPHATRALLYECVLPHARREGSDDLRVALARAEVPSLLDECATNLRQAFRQYASGESRSSLPSSKRGSSTPPSKGPSTSLAREGKDVAMSHSQWLQLLTDAGVLEHASHDPSGGSRPSAVAPGEQRTVDQMVEATPPKQGLSRVEATRIFIQAGSQVWEGSLHCCHELDLEGYGMRFASFAEGVARIAVATSAPDVNDPVVLHREVETFLVSLLSALVHH
ncbi:hypothetical protein AB1Y20_016367 [Prymnesium parvum]|uniref:CAAX prenyl protease 2/Lysostaphin resistance protein A-like domain-containing protein n=1 Tax=Prymnesium parvum TaxID=97485 RepID=A0AB34IDS9_PRYPA